MPNDYYTYIMTNQSNSTLYVGVTNDIERRSLEHISGVGASFTSKYKINNQDDTAINKKETLYEKV